MHQLVQERSSQALPPAGNLVGLAESPSDSDVGGTGAAVVAEFMVFVMVGGEQSQNVHYFNLFQGSELLSTRHTHRIYSDAKCLVCNCLIFPIFSIGLNTPCI